MIAAAALLATLALSVALHAGNAPETVTTYRVGQYATVSDIPADAKKAKFWISIPDNERYQEVLDFAVVSSPGNWSVVRDQDRGNRFILVEVKSPGTT